jgi:hypothetical protein
MDNTNNKFAQLKGKEFVDLETSSNNELFDKAAEAACTAQSPFLKWWKDLRDAKNTPAMTQVNVNLPPEIVNLLHRPTLSVPGAAAPNTLIVPQTPLIC